MTDQSQDNSSNSERAQDAGDDLTGRDRLIPNVLSSWVAHFVFIIAGFIMPRMIDRRLGQELLGVWDFAWSLVSYFGLVQGGIGSSVNRYVAKYRAAGDISGVNRIVSSAFCIHGTAGLLALGLTITVSLLLPQLFGTRLGERVHDAQWVVFFLGASMGVQIAFSAFTGVLTGCHCWGLHNINTSGWYVATVTGMIIALLLGGGLLVLAMMTFAGQMLTDATRVILSHRVCKGLRLRPNSVGWKTMRKLFVFGGKSLLPSVSNLMLNQTASILIVAYLGPALLALYSRPRSLVYHMNTLVNKMAMILIPTAGSLQSAGDLEGIRELLIKSVRYSFYMVLPMVLVLVVFGAPILHFWMGPAYANGLVAAILAVGYLATTVQTPVRMILVGLNAHGRAGMAQLVASLCAVGLSLVVLGPLGLGLVGMAIAVTLPLTIIDVVYLPLLVRRQVGLDVKRYFLAVASGPVVYVVPFAICLVGARLIFQTKPLMGLVLGGTGGSAVLAVLYWRYVLPDQVKTLVLYYPCKVMRLAGMLKTRESMTQQVEEH